MNVYIALQELEPDRFRLLWTTAWSIKYPSTVKVFDLNADGIPDYRVETEGAMSHATLSYMLTHPETLVPREVFETKIASPPNNSCAGFERKIRLGVRDSSRMPELLVSIVPLYDFDNPECVRASHGDWEAEIRLAMQKSGGVNRYRFDGTSYKIYGEAIDPETWAGP
ncbi:MAG: hypothetical protein NXI24_00355 [bacterium]|nr:hypothetical protein [bacterium]